MRAYLERKEIDLGQVELDAARWEDPRARGDKILYVELAEDDLRAVGESVFSMYRSQIADEPDHFKSEMMEDVPRPASPEVFVKNPKALKRYLVGGSYWRTATIRAIVARMNPFKSAEGLFRIEEFNDLRIDRHHVILLLEVRVGGPEGSRWRTF